MPEFVGQDPFKLLLIQYSQNPLGNCHNGMIGVSSRSKGIWVLGEDYFVRKPVAVPIHDQGKNKCHDKPLLSPK